MLEILVVCFLTGILLTIIANLLGTTMAAGRLDTERAARMNQLMVLMTTVEADLQRACKQGVAYQAGSKECIVAMHLWEAEALTLATQFEADWTCLIWDGNSGRVYRRLSPPHPALAGPPTDRPKAASLSELNQLKQAPQSGARLLASDVSQFELAWESGPVAKVTIQTSLPRSGNTAEPYTLQRSFFLRNSF